MARAQRAVTAGALAFRMVRTDNSCIATLLPLTDALTSLPPRCQPRTLVRTRTELTWGPLLTVGHFEHGLNRDHGRSPLGFTLPRSAEAPDIRSGWRNGTCSSLLAGAPAGRPSHGFLPFKQLRTAGMLPAGRVAHSCATYVPFYLVTLGKPSEVPFRARRIAARSVCKMPDPISAAPTSLSLAVCENLVSLPSWPAFGAVTLFYFGHLDSGRLTVCQCSFCQWRKMLKICSWVHLLRVTPHR